MLEGERLQLKLDIEEAIPTDDGRWQLMVPELTSLRLDQAIFGQVAEGQTQQSQEGMLEAQTVRFILLAGRSLLLDLLMLEAMLVVDEALPRPRCFTSMRRWWLRRLRVPFQRRHGQPDRSTLSRQIGRVSNGRCSRNASPSRSAIVTWICSMSTSFRQPVLTPGTSLQHGVCRGTNGLVPYGGGVMLAGLSLGLLATWVEVQRKSKAAALAEAFGAEGHQWT